MVENEQTAREDVARGHISKSGKEQNEETPSEIRIRDHSEAKMFTMFFQNANNFIKLFLCGSPARFSLLSARFECSLLLRDGEWSHVNFCGFFTTANIRRSVVFILLLAFHLDVSPLCLQQTVVVARTIRGHLSNIARGLYSYWNSWHRKQIQQKEKLSFEKEIELNELIQIKRIYQLWCVNFIQCSRVLQLRLILHELKFIERRAVIKVVFGT